MYPMNVTVVICQLKKKKSKRNVEYNVPYKNCLRLFMPFFTSRYFRLSQDPISTDLLHVGNEQKL